jgi:CubicO group peptidase (beta-lactamase class C family)
MLQMFLFARSFGAAKSADDIFLLASISKPITAAAVMKQSAMGLGRFTLDSLLRCQVDKAAPESGGGDVAAKSWDWNSPYWRKLGAPWGGAHGSAADAARFLAEFLRPSGKTLKPETAHLMIRNHNPRGIRMRGLGFDLGSGAGSPGCSDKTFGHTGSTGTLCWADPATDTICAVLTTLPARAANPYPRDLASDLSSRSEVAQRAPGLMRC